jgi:tetratricopeptide (TPR) repeat protein
MSDYRTLFFISCLSVWAQSNLERPLAIITEGTGEASSSNPNKSWQVEAGSVLFKDERVKAKDGVTVAFCPENGREGWLRHFSAHEQFSVSDIARAATRGAPEQKISVCSLPSIDRSAQAQNAIGPESKQLEVSELAKRVSEKSADLGNQFQAAMGLSRDPRFALVGLITQAAILDESGLETAALDLYRQIRNRYCGALWVRSVITRTVESARYHASPSVELTPKLKPSAGASRAPEMLDFANGQTFALLVGISKYPEGKGPDLPWAAADANTFLEFLTKSKRAGKIGDIIPLTNEAATRDAFEANLLKLIDKGAGKNNTLLVFISSHGTYSCSESEQDIQAGRASSTLAPRTCPEGENPFIVMRDGAAREAPNIAGYSMERLRDLVTQARNFGRVLMFVDVCHGGNTTWKEDVKPPPKNRDLVKTLKSNNGHLGIITGSEVGEKGSEAIEIAWESSELKHGVFSFYLLNGLNGAAKSRGNVLDIGDLHSYVFSSVRDYIQTKTKTPRLQSPSQWWTEADLPVLDHAQEPPIDLKLTQTSDEKPLIPTSVYLSYNDFGLNDALRSGELLGPASRVQRALEAIRAQYGTGSAEHQDGLDRYRVALEENGQDVLVRYLRGDQDQLAPEEFDRCGDLFEAALGLARDAAFDESRALFCRGRRRIFNRDYDGARLLLQRSIGIDPGRSYAYNALGISYLEQANKQPAFLPRALQAFSEAIRFEPKWAYPRHNLALAQTESGNYAAAALTYRNAMVVGPEYSYLPYNLGLLYQNIYNYGESQSAYRQAIRVAEKRCEVRRIPTKDACPERALPRAGMASILAETGRKRRSESLYADALKDSPGDLLIEHDLASLYAGWKGHESEGMEIWKANLVKDPGHLPSLIGFTTALKRGCDFKTALPYLKRLTEKASEYQPSILDLALAQVRTGSAAEASITLKRVKVETAEYWAVRAEVEEGVGNREGAATAWETAFDQAGDNSMRKQFEWRRRHVHACPFR